MNFAYAHLLLNHVPVLGTAFGIVLLAYAVLRKSEEVTRVALVVFVVVALLSIPAYLTGEPAGDQVEKIPGVSQGSIERHDEAAEIALTGMEILGGVSLLGLFFFRRAPVSPRWFVSTALLLAVVVGGLMARTAKLGGEIRHSELAGPVAFTESHGD